MTRPDRSARREALLDAADRAVRQGGPATSMAGVAAAAGITKPVLYRHFGDRAGLVAALADRHTARLMTALRAALQTGSTRRERVERTVDAYLAAIEADPLLYRFLLRPDDAAAPAQVRGFTQRLAVVLAAGIAAELGLPAAGTRELTWAHGIVGMVQGAGDWWLDTRPCPRAELAAQLAGLLPGAYGQEHLGERVAPRGPRGREPARAPRTGGSPPGRGRSG